MVVTLLSYRTTLGILGICRWDLSTISFPFSLVHHNRIIHTVTGQVLWAMEGAPGSALVVYVYSKLGMLYSDVDTRYYVKMEGE